MSRPKHPLRGKSAYHWRTHKKFIIRRVVFNMVFVFDRFLPFYIKSLTIPLFQHGDMVNILDIIDRANIVGTGTIHIDPLDERVTKDRFFFVRVIQCNISELDGFERSPIRIYHAYELELKRQVSDETINSLLKL